MFDLQVNGYAGTDFNGDDLTAEDLHHACECLREDGVESILATIITDGIDTMCRRLARLVELRLGDPLAREMIPGFHIEGPFINETPGFVGAHPAACVRQAETDMMNRLLDAAGGHARLVTLAPERDPGFRVTRLLATRGVIISAGHCDATLDELRGAIDAGLTMFTHLGNGCPMETHRHDNIIQRALSLHDRLWLAFIPDGVHVPFFALGNYLRACGLDRAIFVTDAISAARLGPGVYQLAGWKLRIGDDLVARAPDGSHFVGSTVTRPRILSEAAPALGLDDAQIDSLININPRKALGLP